MKSPISNFSPGGRGEFFSPSKSPSKLNLSASSPIGQHLYNFFIHSKEKNKEIHHTWIQPKETGTNALHNSSCEICSQFATFSREVLQCIYCNVVCHRSCLENQLNSLNSPSVSSVLTSVDHKGWVCFYCQDSLQYDLQLHDTATMIEEYRQLVYRSQTMIAKHWRRYLRRSWYIRVYSAIVRMQIQFQVKKRKRVFLHSVQSKLRTIKIKIYQITQLFLLDREAKLLTHNTNNSNNNNNLHSPSNEKQKVRKREYHIYIMVTVCDLTQGTSVQTWRLESPTITVHALPLTLPDILLEERFILGGVSGFQHIVISIFQKGTVRDIFLGQVGVELGSNSLWRKGGKFILPLLTCGYEIKDVSGMDFKADYRFQPQGTIYFDIITSHGMNAECCPCYGTSVEEIIRSLHKLPDTTGFYIPVRKIVTTTGKLNPIINKGMIQSISDQTSVSSSTAISLAGSMNNNNSASVSVSSLSTLGTVDGAGIAMKKMWIAITEGKLYLFGHFGDQLKLSIDLQFFSISYEFCKNNQIMYKLYRIGYPEFHFYPVHEHDIFRMKCAFLASVRFAKGFAISSNLLTSSNNNSNNTPGGGRHQRILSNLSHSNDNNHNMNNNSSLGAATSIGEKFDVSYLVGDLLALEVMKNRKLQQLSNKEGNSFRLGSFGSNRKKNTSFSQGRLVTSPHARNTVQLSPINRNINNPSRSPSTTLHGVKSLPDISPKKDSLLPESPEDKMKPQRRGSSMPQFAPTLRRSMTEKIFKKVIQGFENDNEVKRVEVVKEEIEQQVMQELTIDEVAANQKFQTVGDVFMNNLIDDLTEQKVQSQLLRKQTQSSQFATPTNYSSDNESGSNKY